ncbi:hypothetical protein ACWCPT_13940 [Streptomyces sp. NPDC002308]
MGLELQGLLQSLLGGSRSESHAGAWDAVIDRWVPPLETADADDPATLDRFIARLAADGLWLYESLTAHRLSPHLRRAVAERIADTLGHDAT